MEGLDVEGFLAVKGKARDYPPEKIRYFGTQVPNLTTQARQKPRFQTSEHFLLHHLIFLLFKAKKRKLLFFIAFFFQGRIKIVTFSSTAREKSPRWNRTTFL